MLNTKEYGQELRKRGFDFFSGVPCSFLQDLINYAINEASFIMAANEGDAVAICAGAQLGGRKAVFLCQNSGLTNAISPLTSLNHIFRIPILGYVSLRGEPGTVDEPQHELMGAITTRLLEEMKIDWEYLAKDMPNASAQLKRADECIKAEKSFFFVVRKGMFEKESLKDTANRQIVNQRKVLRSGEEELPTRHSVLAIINKLKDHDTIVLAATGFTGRELYELEDAPNNFYMVGSMGCLSSVGLGLSLAKREIKVVAIDGDGALLMRLGALATNASAAPNNMLHILLDNNAHESTGGQQTVSHNVDFIDVTAACGYSQVVYIHNLRELQAEIMLWQAKPALTFLYLKIAKGTKENLGRPKITPSEVKKRLMRFLNER